jgi:hypothetical protein
MLFSLAVQLLEVAVQLTHLDPVRNDGALIGWTARFTDKSGLVRIATLGLHCVMDPSAFAKAVAAQGIPCRPPGGTDKTAWHKVVHELRRRSVQRSDLPLFGLKWNSSFGHKHL